MNQLKISFGKFLSQYYTNKQMIILGDIGNTETKICLVNNYDKIIKKIVIPSKGKKLNLLNKYFKNIADMGLQN